jgi:hypothetical protein
MMSTLKTIAEIVSAFGTLIIAGIVAYIAYRQHRTEKSRLKLDLYDRRLQTFQAGMEFIAHVVQNVDADDQALAAVNRARLEGLFLFPEGVVEYFSTLHDKGVDLRCINKALDGGNLPVGQERAQKTHEQGELVKWFARQFKELQGKLRPHMGFDE